LVRQNNGNGLTLATSLLLLLPPPLPLLLLWREEPAGGILP
jgi:hypothetical protein